MLDYLKTVPKSVPSGKIVAHNNVRPARRSGTRGFRFWFADAGDPLYEFCWCKWAPELGDHYRPIEPGFRILKTKGPAMLDYLKTVPKSVPSGKIVAHNNVYPVARRGGTRGSRFWLADAGDPLYEFCWCKWAPELGDHYRPIEARRVSSNDETAER